jgi:hypothetical protein
VFFGSRERPSTSSSLSTWVREEPPESRCVFSGSPETGSTTPGVFFGSPARGPAPYARPDTNTANPPGELKNLIVSERR